ANVGLQAESAVAVRKIEKTQTDFSGAERRPVILAIPPLSAPPRKHAIACIFVGKMTGWRRPCGAAAAPCCINRRNGPSRKRSKMTGGISLRVAFARQRTSDPLFPRPDRASARAPL